MLYDGLEGLVPYLHGTGTDTRRGERYVRGPIIQEDVPELLHWAMVEEEPGRGILFEGAVAVEPETSVDLTRSVQEWISAERNAWILRHNTFQNKGENVAMAIQRGEVQTSSNGSYMPQLDLGVAMAAWILECPCTGEQCKGVVQVPGGEQDINAFQVEVMGNLARILVLEVLCQN